MPNLGKHGRYRCRTYGTCEASASAAADLLEELVTEAVYRSAFTGRLVRERAEQPDFSTLDAEIARARASYERWLEREDDMADDAAAWNRRRLELKEKIESAEYALHDAKESAGAVSRPAGSCPSSGPT